MHWLEREREREKLSVKQNLAVPEVQAPHRSRLLTVIATFDHNVPGEKFSLFNATSHYNHMERYFEGHWAGVTHAELVTDMAEAIAMPSKAPQVFLCRSRTKQYLTMAIKG